MRKLLLLTSLVLLSACSEKVEQNSEEIIGSTDVNISVQENESDSEVNETLEEETEKEISDEKATELQEQQINVTEQTQEETVQEKSQATADSALNTKESTTVIDIKEEGLFSYYANEEIEDEIEFTNIDETTLELPLYSENEKVFEDDITKVTLEDFQSGEIEYFEEPISNGYLIALNLNKLAEENYGKSYSLLYNDIEYAFFVTEDDPNAALGVIENVDLESVKKAQLLIMK